MVGNMFLFTLCWCAVFTGIAGAKEYRNQKALSPVHKPLDIKSVTPDGLMGDWRLVQSPTLDHKGQHYYFLSSDYDLVSSQMAKGTWENRLNVMFKDLWEKRPPGEKHQMVVDVGVNFGNFYMYAAALGCHMLGFEMQPKLYNIVEMSIRLSGYKSHSTLVNNAVWYNQLEMSFTPVVYGPKQTNLGYTHLVEGGKGDVRINTTRIDDVLVNPKIKVFFLKVDVEEAEPQALLGMNSIFLAQRVKHMVIELKTPTILEPLYLTGFSCRMFDSSKICAWPNIDDSCNMPTWDSMLGYFKNHPPENIKKKYYDIHCTLGDSVSTEDISVLKKQIWNKLRNVAYIRNENHHFEVHEDFVIPIDSSSLSSGKDVLEVSYADLFLLSMSTAKM